ncbi:UDP-glucose 4-epimerase GalE [Kiloniella sp.]|uniref:UDP-glucose 4-epimerase GalE n=1 Tax=Kiloniella sp. TaxID=1938587 RepID=UPI003B0272E0
MRVLLTGGTGYIGSHAAVALAKADHDIVLFDNLSNSSQGVIPKLELITGKSVPFVKGDISDTPLLIKTLTDYKIDAVLHFAGLKAVGESVAKPIQYYSNNVGGTISLLKALQETNVRTLVFSSSATVYGNPEYLPLDEDHPVSSTNPYGQTKIQIEEILADLAKSDSNWQIACLRYFNPVGAHESGLIGEDPQGIPNNLMPYINKVASGDLPKLSVFGGDYPTPDGTGVRDYIHVLDLVEGHLAALDFLQTHNGWHAVNLGTGQGYSVLDMIKAFEVATGCSVLHEIVQRRPGDIATCYAEANKAANQLNWKATRTLEEMCESAWNFQKNNHADSV